MQPEFHERLAGGGFALRDLVLVMGKDQIAAAGVDVERFAQVLHRHGGALDVPAGPPGAEGRLPERLAFFRGFPKHEIAGIGLVVFIRVHASARAHAGKINLSQLTVMWEGADFEVNRPLARVSVSPVHQRLDELHHFFDVVGGTDQKLRILQVQQLPIDLEGLDVLVGIGAKGHTRRPGIADGIVVNIREVDDVAKLKPPVLQVPAEDILKNEGAIVANVRVVVNRGPAGVNAHGVAFEGLKLLDLPRERVVEA